MQQLQQSDERRVFPKKKPKISGIGLTVRRQARRKLIVEPKKDRDVCSATAKHVVKLYHRKPGRKLMCLMNLMIYKKEIRRQNVGNVHWLQLPEFGQAV